MDLIVGVEDCYLEVPNSEDTKLSETTACNYLTLCRDMVCQHMLDNQDTQMVGGPGTTCEIDESMFQR